MMFPPARTRANCAPMIEAMIETPPIASGRSQRLLPANAALLTPRSTNDLPSIFLSNWFGNSWLPSRDGKALVTVGATGEAHSVREFVAEAFRLVGISNWEKHVTIDEKNIRPSEVYNLRGDASKAKRVLGWEPKTRFKDLVRIMVEAEIGSLEDTRPAKGVPSG